MSTECTWLGYALAVDWLGPDHAAASASQMGHFETEWLVGATNLTALATLSGAWIDRMHEEAKMGRGILLYLLSVPIPNVILLSLLWR